MEEQQKFLAMDQQDRFRFLYLTVKENERFILKWLADEYQTSAENKRESIESIRTSFDFLHTIIHPGISRDVVVNKELLLNGMADDLLSMSMEVADLNTRNAPRVARGIAAIEGLFTCIIDYFFYEGDYDADNSPFHVILLSAPGNYIGSGFEGWNSEFAYPLAWADMEVLKNYFPLMETVVSNFIDSVFKRS